MGAGVTEQRAVSHTGSGRGLSPMRWSPTPETNLTNGHTAPMRGWSRRPTVRPGGEQETLSLSPFLPQVWRRIAAEAPNKAVEVRSVSLKLPSRKDSGG